MPPIELPWPPRNLVVEWTTMSAPHSNGWQRIGRGQRVVDDQRDAGLVGDRGDRLEIDDDAAGIGQVLDEDRLAARRQRARGNSRDRRGSTKMACPAELLERQAELGERAAIEVARGDELVARLHQREEDQELRGVARGAARGAAAALEAGDAFLEHRDGRVGQARVDVAEVVQVEERGGVVDIVEHVGGGLVDRRDARAGGRIGRRPAWMARVSKPGSERQSGLVGLSPVLFGAVPHARAASRAPFLGLSFIASPACAACWR